MPIFEYRCKDCEKAFETLVIGREETPECPTCHGVKLERLLSTFAAVTGTSTEVAAPGACGSCGDPRGPGSCSMN